MFPLTSVLALLSGNFGLSAGQTATQKKDFISRVLAAQHSASSDHWGNILQLPEPVGSATTVDQEGCAVKEPGSESCLGVRCHEAEPFSGLSHRSREAPCGFALTAAYTLRV